MESTPDKNKSIDVKQLLAEQTERLKELATINRTNQILKEGKSIEETLQQICLLIPDGWQYPSYTSARIWFDNKEYCTNAFEPTKWVMRQTFSTIEDKSGAIEVYYTRQFVESFEGPFLKEERDLIDNLASLISGFINTKIAVGNRSGSSSKKPGFFEEENLPSPANRKLLQTFLNKNNFARDTYHDLMPFKVKEILLVANLYDAYSIEKEGRFSEHVLGEYSNLNLTSIPRITGASSPEEVFEQLKSRHFDLIIFMMGVDKKLPIELSKKIKVEYPYIPLFLLLNNNADMELFEEKKPGSIDRIFVWNGDSSIFFTMIKMVEDKINVKNDTQVGLVRVILLVEDSAQYYSRYLPMLYKIVLEQTRRIIDDVSTDDLYKVLRLRARPKLLLASSYEEALEIYFKYKDYLLCLITDVEFKKDGKQNQRAGFELLSYVRSLSPDLPAIVQSSDVSNVEIAHQLKATFIDKNSQSLNQDFRGFITHYLGFGNFIYKNKKGKRIAEAKSLKEFEQHLKSIPDESLVYHARKNHFSMWLMARGEIHVARVINPAKVGDFESPSGLRAYLIEKIQKFRNEQNRGKVIPFEENFVLDESNIVSLSDGALGGKGRGLSFINSLIYNFDFNQIIPGINIKTPVTLIIGANEFETFIQSNHLEEVIYNGHDYEEIKKRFVEAKLSSQLTDKLKKVLKLINKPIAVRSSGLFEDSLTQPFAGIFSTYLLPNNQNKLSERLEQCSTAIKLVYASVFSNTARGYIRAVNYKIEEEKMAVVLQELVGREHDSYFYPHISGVAQSFNYYPFSYIKPEDGFAVSAVGLGCYVVEGEKAYRFCPAYPNVEINSSKDQFKNSQVHFYAVDMNNKAPDLMLGEDAALKKLDISEAEKHGTLKHCASVYDPDADRIIPGIDAVGPRLVNFANILKYNYIPLAESLKSLLAVVREAMGSPVEIEYAIDLNKDKDGKATFYLLQIKPLIGSSRDYEVNLDKIDKDRILLFTKKGMGNGKIQYLEDVIYIDYSRFDKSKTEDMAKEISEINDKMHDEGKNYVLIGPGRWGTRDRWIGIPVTWPQISNAKIIVETSFEDFPLDASSGSHFFHNVTSMNIGYLTVQQELEEPFINWDILKKQELISQGKYFSHVRFKKPLTVRMDGKKGISVITFKMEE